MGRGNERRERQRSFPIEFADADGDGITGAVLADGGGGEGPHARAEERPCKHGCLEEQMNRGRAWAGVSEGACGRARSSFDPFFPGRKSVQNPRGKRRNAQRILLRRVPAFVPPNAASLPRRSTRAPRRPFPLSRTSRKGKVQLTHVTSAWQKTWPRMDVADETQGAAAPEKAAEASVYHGGGKGKRGAERRQGVNEEGRGGVEEEGGGEEGGEQIRCM